MTDFDQAHAYLIVERVEELYSDALHIDTEAAAAYAVLHNLDPAKWPDWIDAADAAYRGSWVDNYVRPAIDPVDSTYSVVAGHMFRTK